MGTATSNQRNTMTADERRQAMAATLPEGDCDCNPCLDSLITEAAHPDTMILTIELTDTDYLATMHALRHAISVSRSVPRSYLSDIDKLELLHLMTLLAEAAAPKDTT